MDQDRVVVLHTRQKTPVGRRDAARLGAFVSARNERGFWTAIPPLKERKEKFCGRREFFHLPPFQKKKKFALQPAHFGASVRRELFGGDFITFQIAVFSHSKIRGGGNPNDFVNSQLEFSGNEKEVPNHACFSQII